MKPRQMRESEPSSKSEESVTQEQTETQDQASASDQPEAPDHSTKPDQAVESKQAGDSDQAGEQEVAAKTGTESSGMPDATMQAVLLALASAPVSEPAPTAVPDVMGQGMGSGQEDAHSIPLEGTPSSHASVVGAAVSQAASDGAKPAASHDESSPASSSIAGMASLEEPAPVPGMQTMSVMASDEPVAAQASPVARQTPAKDAKSSDAQPLVSAVPVAVPPTGSVAVPTAVPQAEAQPASLESLQLPVHEQDEVRQTGQARPESLPEQPQPKKLSASDEPTVTAAAWQSFSEEHRTQNGSDLSEQERRDRQSENVFPASAGAAPGQAPAQASFAGVAAGVADSRTVLTGQPASPAHQASQPAMSQSVQATDWMPAEGPNHTRSVVLEVAQADLGRVNIRVAMNQDTVHAYFTSDRAEVGQFLANGQEKLQAALQNAGLDMGQFRVDIDRQSAGRSFQQQTPQGQNQWDGAYRQGGSQGQGSDAALASTHHRPGILNLVA
ncbi:MAG: flagellar hook-length control protein FliK [Nitrospira sp.]|nr:flagellar hook-length control protein FliK [Nitrospira sp.]